MVKNRTSFEALSHLLHQVTHTLEHLIPGFQAPRGLQRWSPNSGEARRSRLHSAEKLSVSSVQWSLPGAQSWPKIQLFINQKTRLSVWMGGPKWGQVNFGVMIPDVAAKSGFLIALSIDDMYI